MTTETVQLAIAVFLAAAVVSTGVWVTQTKHDSRRLFAELEELKREQDRLQIDWGRLQLEQSTWATHPRIESVAREQLQLAEPQIPQILLVAEPPR